MTLTTDPTTSARMSRQRTTGTAPELAIRRRVHAEGLRYRVDAPLPTNRRRRADLLHGPSKVAVFVDGCYWHGCPDHYRTPRTNAAWWDAKIERNRQRDRETDRQLRTAGWLPIRLWEHENADKAARRVIRAIQRRRVIL
jgi:DNA mismatch endonuclease (patch repair protein)